MSESPSVALTPRELARLKSRVLSYYFTTVVLCFLGIAVLVAYCISLGTLVGPGVEESLGLALGVLFLLAALMMHTLDRAYREWPLGRLVHPETPRTLTDLDVAFVLKIVVVASAAALIAYVLAELIL